MTKALPARPSLEHLQKQAKRLLRDFRVGKATALAWLKMIEPKHQALSDAQLRSSRIALKDIQRLLARDYGFDSWIALKEAVERAGATSASDIPAEAIADFARCVAALDLPAVAALLYRFPAIVDTALAGEQPWQGEISPARPDERSFRALHFASLNGHAELARLLLEHGADANALCQESNRGATPPVVLAAWEGGIDVLRVLLEHGADPNQPAENDETALDSASRHENGAACALLLQHGARTGFMSAARLGNVPRIRATLDEGGVNRAALQAALDEAAWHGQQDVVRALRRRGAEPNLWQWAGLGNTDEMARLAKGRGRRDRLSADRGEENWRSGSTPLDWAAHGGHALAIDWLCKHGADVTKGHPFGMAALNRDLNVALVVRPLVRAGADINKVFRGFTPHQRAVRNGNHRLATVLWRYGAWTDDDRPAPVFADAELSAALDKAYAGNDRPALRAMIERHPDLTRTWIPMPGVKDSTSLPLHFVASTGDAETARLYLERGADANAAEDSEDQRTPLHIAAMAGDLSMVSLLLDAGALVDLLDARGKTAFHHAIFARKLDVAEILLKRGADINRRIRDWSLLTHEVKDGKNASVRFMLEHGANVHVLDDRVEWDSTPLHAAAERNRVNAAGLLLAHGADANARNGLGHTPLDIALAGKHDAVAALLRAHGAARGTVARYGTL